MIDNEERFTVEKKEKWRDWCSRMPILHFEKEWDVKIIPPFGGALARFTVEYNENYVSVYFDAFSTLGYMYQGETPIPYWEIFDGEETERFDFTQEGADEMMRRIKEILKGENDD